MTPASFEKHFTAKEVAELWGLDSSTVRRIFRDVPGVLKIEGKGPQRDYCTVRIPESVVRRVHMPNKRPEDTYKIHGSSRPVRLGGAA